MFNILPEECLFIIIQYLLEDNTKEGNIEHFEHQTIKKNWKLAVQHQYPLTPFNFNEGHRYKKIITWKNAPFTRITPIMKICPDVFNTNSIWTYILEKEFRKGKRYKRKPKNAKNIFKKKVQKIIHKRYVPLLYKEEEISKYSHKEYIKTTKQINTIYKSLQSIKPEIQDLSEIDENKPLPPIKPIHVKIPKGFIGRWDVQLQWDCYFDMKQLSHELNYHERIAKKHKKYHDTTKKNIHQFKKIINQVMEEQLV